jgi:aerobic-type carbon monoxide dehydrogenase small subunit (CoxS/CutS family)
VSGLLVRLKGRAGPPIAFTIDGAPAEAMPGDLLLSAILLHRPALRRFEFGDGARAGYCLMGACQDCWVRLADGRRLRACTTLVEPGLVVETGLGRG